VAACACALLVAHLYLHDYDPVADVADSLAGSMALGAALIASTLLASRLRSEAQVLALTCFAVTSFVGWPFLRRDVATASFAAHAALTMGMHTAATAALAATVAPLLAVVYAAAVLFITLACPAALVSCNDIKQRING